MTEHENHRGPAVQPGQTSASAGTAPTRAAVRWHQKIAARWHLRGATKAYLTDPWELPLRELEMVLRRLRRVAIQHGAACIRAEHVLRALSGDPEVVALFAAHGRSAALLADGVVAICAAQNDTSACRKGLSTEVLTWVLRMLRVRDHTNRRVDAVALLGTMRAGPDRMGSLLRSCMGDPLAYAVNARWLGTPYTVYGARAHAYQVVLHNDEETTAGHITDILVNVFKLETQAANRLMWHIDKHGAAGVGSFSLEEAQAKALEVMAGARIAGFPLTVGCRPTRQRGPL